MDRHQRDDWKATRSLLKRIMGVKGGSRLSNPELAAIVEYEVVCLRTTLSDAHVALAPDSSVTRDEIRKAIGDYLWP